MSDRRPLRLALAVALCLGACRGRQASRVPADAGAVVVAADAGDDAGEPAAPRGRQLALLYSSNDLGEYERCGCPVHPLGGLARRAVEIDRARADSDAVLVVDAGDLFLPAAEPAAGGARPPAASELERRARLLAAVYARLGVAAFSPGERDLALGAARLRRVLADARVPVVSANLVDLSGRAPWPADRLLVLAGIEVGVFGVTAVSPPDGARLRAWGFVALDPAAAARAEVASLRARGARVVVALVHVGGTPDSKKLLAAAPGIDWAVLGHSGMNLEDPEVVAGGARMLEAMSLGRQEGRLDLHFVDDTSPFVARGARAQLRTIRDDHARQIAEYEQRLPTTARPELRAYYEQRLADLRKAIARETGALAALPPRVTGNWFENRILPLDAAAPDQPGVALLVGAYNRASERLAAAGHPVGIKPIGPGTSPEPSSQKATAETPSDDALKAPATYVGNAACNRCHPNAVNVWLTTKHAQALATLEKAHRARSPECVPCHVTGYLRAGGATDLAVATAEFANVGCEACHGPGSTHVEAVSKRDTIARKVPATVCLGCHTPDQTNDGFDYAKFLPGVLGSGHGG